MSGSAVVETRWGMVGMVESGGAVVFLTLADDEMAARKVLEGVLPGAGLGERATELAEEVALRIEAGRSLEGIPFEASGTEFQEAIWDALVQIPKGATLTYGELAGEAGRPGAARAAGAACGANPVALLIPCHRAVGSNGALGGYRWGLERKAMILSAEGVEPVSR